MQKIFTYLLAIIFTISIYVALLTGLTKPSNDRNWTIDQKILSEIYFASSTDKRVEIKNIKNFSYKENNENEKIANFYTDTFESDNISNVWFFQNDFTEPLGAHTFLTFEFAGNETKKQPQYLSVSAEIRKEVGETYSPFRGLFNHYELHYMLVSEKDILTLRAGLREPDVFMYKLKLSSEEKQQLFNDVLKRADKINKFPEFYNTYSNACTTNIVQHLNNILATEKMPGNSWKVIFPKYSDEFLYASGLIDTGLTFPELKQSSLINHKVREAIKSNLSDTEFSQFIRQNYVENFKG